MVACVTNHVRKDAVSSKIRELLCLSLLLLSGRRPYLDEEVATGYQALHLVLRGRREPLRNISDMTVLPQREEVPGTTGRCLISDGPDSAVLLRYRRYSMRRIIQPVCGLCDDAGEVACAALTCLSSCTPSRSRNSCCTFSTQV